jgi:signal transduction histidine kinase/ActR/RegA family two-component response regulator
VVGERLEHIGDYFKSCRERLLARWCEKVRSDNSLPQQRLSFSEEELQDHLPALLDSIIEALKGRQADGGTIRQRGSQHGHTRRLNGYSIEQVIWEFAVFRKLLREALEEIATTETRENLFAAVELVIDIVDRSEIGSIHQYVEEANQERDTVREALHEANQQKDQFLAVLSHELRNPLAAICTAIHIIKAPGFSEAQKSHALEIIDRQTEFQRRLVDDLLDVNRISQGRIELKRETIDLRNPIKNAIDAFLPAIEAKDIRFQFIGADHAVAAFADPVRIEQIVSNLLNNALKFTSSEGSIEVSLSQSNEVATISVHDTGAGLDPTTLGRIFDLFSQAVSGPTDAGLGIGLWLAKQLTEMHGGTIQANSDGPGRGAHLSVQLPCLPLGMEQKRTTRTRVLFVEDDPDQRELLQIALSETGAEILATKDGAEALRLASKAHFDVCLLDLNLPDMSGYDLCQRLLEIYAERRPLLIALTGFGRPEDKSRVMAAGFDHHIVKPPDIAMLQKLILSADSLRSVR